MLLASFALAAPLPAVQQTNSAVARILAKKSVGCTFVNGDGTGASAKETFLGDMPHEECAAAVRAKVPSANGATVSKLGRVSGGHPGCWAEEGMTGTTNPDGSYMSCLFEGVQPVADATALKESERSPAHPASGGRDLPDDVAQSLGLKRGQSSSAAAAPAAAARVQQMQQQQASHEPMPSLMAIPVDGAPNPLPLMPKGSEMCLVTSHFALPMKNSGEQKGLTQEFVDSLSKMSGGMIAPDTGEDNNYHEHPGDSNPHSANLAANMSAAAMSAKLVNMMASGYNDHFGDSGPSDRDFGVAERLLRKSQLYKTVQELKASKRAGKLPGSASKLASLRAGSSTTFGHAVLFKALADAQNVFFQAARHYAMIEASIVTNMLNYPTLSEVYVIYDSVMAENHCTHLKARLLAKASAVLKANGFSGQTEGRVAKLKCMDRHESQPSYWEMFDLASNKLEIDSPVVVMGNGDGATDETLGMLSAVQPGVAVMISVTGFGEDSTLTEWQTNNLLRQPSAQKVFESLIGPFEEVCDPKPKSRCLRTYEQRRKQAEATFEEGHPGEWHYFRWPEQMLSWDAYVFRRPLPPLSPKILHPGIFMNMPGAENRAGMALYLALGKDQLIYNNTLPNACGHVNWYHYHCTGQAVQYDPTDNVAITTHEWRSLFGNVSVPPKSMLSRGMDIAIGVDNTYDLELTIRHLIVPITSGCAALQACLHVGRPTHHALPDEIAFLNYDPTCTQPECKEVQDNLLPELDDDKDDSVDPTADVSTQEGEDNPHMSSMHQSAQKGLRVTPGTSCADAIGDKKLVSHGTCGHDKQAVCTMCCSAEGYCGSDKLSCGEGHQADYSLRGRTCWPSLKYERLETNSRCKNELFLPKCTECKNQLNVDWGFEPKANSLYVDHLPSSDLLYTSDKIMECMNRCQHHYGSEESPIKAFSLDSHARCACAVDDCGSRVAVPPPATGNRLMDMTASYKVAVDVKVPRTGLKLYSHNHFAHKEARNKREKEAIEAKLGANETEREKNRKTLQRLEPDWHPKHATELLAGSTVKTHSSSSSSSSDAKTATAGHSISAHEHSSKMSASGKSAPITIHAGAQFEDAMLINHVLNANAVGLLEEKDLLYPLSSDAWGNAHHFWVAQACQCNPFIVVEKINYADNWHTPVWYPMAMTEMMANLNSLNAKYQRKAKPSKSASRAGATAAPLPQVSIKGTHHELQLLASQARAHVTGGIPAPGNRDSTDFHRTLTKLRAKADTKDTALTPSRSLTPTLDSISTPYPPDSPEQAGNEDYPGNTKPYVGVGFAGSQQGEYPVGSTPRYESQRQESAAAAQAAAQAAASPLPPIAIDPSLDNFTATVLPGQQDGVDNSDTLSIMKDGWPSQPGEELGWPKDWAIYNWHDGQALKKEAPVIEYRTDAEEAAYQWSLVPEDDFNGVGKDQSKELTDALGDSLAAHTGPKLLSSFTLGTVEIDAVYAAKRMTDMYSSSVRVVCFYRDEKTYFVNRYRYQDLFKTTLDKLGPFEYPTYTMEMEIYESLNSTTKGMDGLVRNGSKIHGYPVGIETLLSKSQRNHTQGWDRLIEVFGRKNFRLIDYHAVKLIGTNDGFDVTSALVELALADPLPKPPTQPPDFDNGRTYAALPTDIRASAYTPEWMDEREVAFRQLWNEFRAYAYTRANCTVVWPWEGRKSMFSTILPMATWDVPVRCFDLTTLDEEALWLDADVRANYGDVLLYNDPAATKKAIHAENEPFCELDYAVIRNDTERWSAFFMQQLMALPYGSCLEGREQKEFLPPPVYTASPPSPPCDEVKPVTEMDPADWAFMPPPLPPPPPSPPPLNEEFTMMFTEASESDRAFSCSSRAVDKPFTQHGVPTQYVHVPKAAGSSIQMLLAYYIAIPQDIFFIVGEVQDYPVNPPGTMFAGHSPIVNSPDSKYQAKRDFYARNPFFISTIREPLARMISLYDYRALFNMSMCEGPLDEDGYYSRIGFLDIMFPGPSKSMCEAIAQFKLDEIDAIASGVAEDGLMDHFFRKRHPLVVQMTKETLYSWFIPRDDPMKIYPTTTEAALACAMANALRTDVIINSERYDTTVLPSLKYHAPYLKWDTEKVLEDTTTNVVAGQRAPQKLTQEVIDEIQRMPTFVQDTRFYLFADKVAMAREANLFACMKAINETELIELAGGELPLYPGAGACKETCDDVLTEDEWLMIKNADCGKKPESYPYMGDGGPESGAPEYPGSGGIDNGAVPGHPELPPV